MVLCTHCLRYPMSLRCLRKERRLGAADKKRSKTHVVHCKVYMLLSTDGPSRVSGSINTEVALDR